MNGRTMTESGLQADSLFFPPVPPDPTRPHFLRPALSRKNTLPQMPSAPSAVQSLWIVASAACFAAMGVFVKFGAEQFSVLELVFYRSVVPALALAAVAGWRRHALRTGHIAAHLRRGLAGFAALSLFFFAIPRLALPTAQALQMTSPLFLAGITAYLLREKITAPLALALLSGFCGMLFVLRPGLSPDQLLGAAAGLGSGFFSGIAYFNIRQLGRVNEGGLRTVFYFSAISAILALALILAYGKFSPMTVGGAAILLATGLTATMGQLTLTRALHFGHSAVVSALMYSSVIFCGILEYAVWRSAPQPADWAGIAMIVFGGAFALYVKMKRPADAKAK